MANLTSFYTHLYLMWTMPPMSVRKCIHQDASMENSSIFMLQGLFLVTKKRENSFRVQHINCLLWTLDYGKEQVENSIF